MKYILSKDKTTAVNLEKVVQIYISSTATGDYMLSADTDGGSIVLGEYSDKKKAQKALVTILQSLEEGISDE